MRFFFLHLIIHFINNTVSTTSNILSPSYSYNGGRIWAQTCSFVSDRDSFTYLVDMFIRSTSTHHTIMFGTWELYFTQFVSVGCPTQSTSVSGTAILVKMWYVVTIITYKHQELFYLTLWSRPRCIEHLFDCVTFWFNHTPCFLCVKQTLNQNLWSQIYTRPLQIGW